MGIPPVGDGHKAMPVVDETKVKSDTRDFSPDECSGEYPVICSLTNWLHKGAVSITRGYLNLLTQNPQRFKTLISVLPKENQYRIDRFKNGEMDTSYTANVLTVLNDLTLLGTAYDTMTSVLNKHGLLAFNLTNYLNLDSGTTLRVLGRGPVNVDNDNPVHFKERDYDDIEFFITKRLEIMHGRLNAKTRALNSETVKLKHLEAFLEVADDLRNKGADYKFAVKLMTKFGHNGPTMMTRIGRDFGAEISKEDAKNDMPKWLDSLKRVAAKKRTEITEHAIQIISFRSIDWGLKIKRRVLDKVDFKNDPPRIEGMLKVAALIDSEIQQIEMDGKRMFREAEELLRRNEGTDVKRHRQIIDVTEKGLKKLSSVGHVMTAICLTIFSGSMTMLNFYLE